MATLPTLTQLLQQTKSAAFPTKKLAVSKMPYPTAPSTTTYCLKGKQWDVQESSFFDLTMLDYYLITPAFFHLALPFAAKYGRLADVKNLLTNHVGVFQHTDIQKALNIAVENSQFLVIKWLLENYSQKFSSQERENALEKLKELPTESKTDCVIM